MNFNKIELEVLEEEVNRHSVMQRNKKNNNSEKCLYIYIYIWEEVKNMQIKHVGWKMGSKQW